MELAPGPLIMKVNKKLIEVALPLDAINVASAREKSIRHGHPSTLHLWWARRPLAAARAVIFAQMVDDPSAHPDIFPTEKKQEKERQRLFRIIEDLVKWENTTNEDVLERARAEIWQSWRRSCAENADHPRAKELFNRHILPAFHDPFAGGGTLPLEAQRLGLASYASDLNPVAVLISKALIEIPPRFAGRPPVNRDAEAEIARSGAWHGRGAEGLAEDVRHYGKWMRDEAERRIGHLYPSIEITAELASGRPDLSALVGKKLKVVAWLWARTVKSPNPAFAQVDVPLTTTFVLSSKPGKEVWIDPILEGNTYRFTVRVGPPKDAEATTRGTKSGSSGSSFLCLMSGTPITFEYIRAEAKAGRMGTRLLATVAEGVRGRVYLPPSANMEAVALSASPVDVPDTELPLKALGFRIQEYGMTRWRDIFTARQLVALTTFSGLAREAVDRLKKDAAAAAFPDDSRSLSAGGAGAAAYAEAISTYLGCLVSAVADDLSSIVTWRSGHGTGATRSTFARQAIPMVWDFAEANPFASAAGDLLSASDAVARVIAASPAKGFGEAFQADAVQMPASTGRVFSTDPPYYDNIGYADLSDFFYVWLRCSLRLVFPELFATVAVPKAQELVATPFRHGTREKADVFFLEGMTRAMHRIAEQAHPAFPVTIYYAFKQSETDLEGTTGTVSTGWDTFLDAVIRAGFAISGTWPMRTERKSRSISIGTNALASSIVLVCRPSAMDAPTATRREFLTALKTELPLALAHLQRGNIAPVDLAQAAIGPGMAVYTRYGKVLDAEGKPLSVRTALALINQTLDEALAEQEGDFDADSRWALAWFEHAGFLEGDYGVAETLSTAKNTSVGGMVEAGILSAGRGKVRLLKPDELPVDWDPEDDRHTNEWEMLHHLIRVLEHTGEAAAAELVAKYGAQAEVVRELAYRLYALCERKKRAKEATAYNALVQSWPEIMRLAQESASKGAQQAVLFDQE